MQHNRVVVTGMGGLTALGHDWPTIADNLRARHPATRYIKQFDEIKAMNTRLAAPVQPYDLPEHYDRKRTRSMGPVALMSTRATEFALDDAGLIGDPVLASGRTGIAYAPAPAAPPTSSTSAGLMSSTACARSMPAAMSA